MKPWSEVESSPEFKSLSPQHQSLAQSQYFDEVVAPKLEPQDMEVAREEFFTQFQRPYLPAGTEQGPVESALNAAGRGLGKVATGTVEGLGQFGSSYVRNLNPVGLAAHIGVPGAQSLVDTVSAIPQSIAEGADAAQQYVEEALPVNPLYADAVGTKAAETVGQAGGQILSMLAGTTVTKAPKVLQILGLGQAGALGLESGYTEADRLGVTKPWERDTLAAIYAASEAGVEGMGGFGTPTFAKALTGEVRELLTGTALRKAAGTALKEGAEEPITGTLQDIGSNIIAERDPENPAFTPTGAQIPTLDPFSREFITSRAEEAIYGTLGGSVFAGVQYAMTRPKLEQAQKLHQRVVLSETLLEDKPDPTPQDIADLAEIRENKRVLEEVIGELKNKLAVPADLPETPEAEAAAVLSQNVDVPEVAATAEALAEVIASTEEEMPAPEAAPAEAPTEPFIAPEDEIVTGEMFPTEQPPTPQTDAIQEQVTESGLSRQEGPPLELPPVGEGNAQIPAPALPGEETTVEPEAIAPPLEPASLPAEPPRPLTLAERFPEVPRSPSRTPVPEDPAAVQALNTSPDRRRSLPKGPLGISDVLDYLSDNKIYVPKDKGLRQGGEYDWILKDDRVGKYFRNFIATSNPAYKNADVVAQMAYEDGIISEPTADALGQAVTQAINTRKTIRAEVKREGSRQKQQVEQAERFARDTKKGDVPVEASDLVKGDTMILNGEPLTVIGIEYDEDGYPQGVTLRDGAKYGVQSLEGNEAILVDEFRPSPRRIETTTAEFVPESEIEPLPPAPAPAATEVPLTLESQSPQQVAEEREKAAGKASIAKKQAAPLKGTLRAEDTTPGMLDPTAGGLFAQPSKKPEQPSKTKGMILWGRKQSMGGKWLKLTDNTSNEEVKRREKEGWEVLKYPEGSHPDDIQKLPTQPASPAPAMAEEIDPYFAMLGRSPTTPAALIADELTYRTEEERAQLQRVLQTSDSKPKTLAAALKKFQPSTGGKEATPWSKRGPRETSARRDELDELRDSEDQDPLEHRERLPYRASLQEDTVPPMPEGEPDFTDWIPVVDKNRAMQLAWRPFAVAWQANNPDATTEELYVAWAAEIADPQSPAIAQGQTDAFMEARRAQQEFGLYSPAPSQTAPEVDKRTRQSRKPFKYLAMGVTRRNAEAAIRGLKGILPKVESAWLGNRMELMSDSKLKRDWIGAYLLQNPGKSQEQANDAFTEFLAFGLNGVQGFTTAGRTYVILDQVGVSVEDTTPSRAVRRVLIHEDAHEAVEALLETNEAARQEWESIRNSIPADSLDDLARRRYSLLKDWRDNTLAHDDLAHEWLAERMETEETRGDPEEDSIIERFKAWLSNILAKLLDRPLETINKSDLLRFVEAGRRARAISPGNETRFSLPDNTVPREVESQIDGQPSAPARILPGAQTQWRYNYWGEKRRQAYTDYQNNPDVPEELKNFTQFMGNPTTNVRLRQTLPRMVDQARAFLGGTGGEQPEVNAENTERAYAVSKELLSRKNFASRYIQAFQDVWSPKDREGRPLHQGSAAVAVLQMELMDYAVRLASTGDIKLAQKLGPFANDVILGDYMTMSNAARALQVRSAAVRDSGFWTALQQTSQGALQLAEAAVGRDKLSELNQAFWGVDVIEQVEKAMAGEIKTSPEADQVERADEAERDAYEMEGWWQRAKEALDEAERADLDALEQAMRQYDLLLQRRAELQAKAGNVAKASAQEDLAKFQTVGEVNAEIAKVKGSIREILKRLTKSDDSGESQEARKKRTRKHKTAYKDLTADQQVKEMLDKLENQKKRTKKSEDKPAWRAVYEDQIKKPKSREAFLAAMEAIGVSRSNADRLFDIAGELNKAREDRKVERQRAREAAKESSDEDEDNKPTTDAIRAIDNFDEEQTEWLPKARTTGDTVKGVIYDAVRDPRPDNSGMNRDAFMSYYRKRLERLEVASEVAWTLADRLWNQNRKLPANKIAKQRFRIERRGNTRSIETQIEEATLEELQDPAWKRQRVEEHFRANGLMSAEAKNAVLEMDDRRIDALMARAQRKVDARAFDAVETSLEADLQRPTQIAQRMISRMDDRQTEAMPKEPAKRETVERVAEAAIREERTDAQRAAGQRMSKDRFIKDTSQALRDAGVEAGAAVNLAERLYAENQRRQANKVIRARKNASNSRAFLNSIVRSILHSPLSQQADPEWRYDTMVTAFRERGMIEEQAEKAAQWLNNAFQKHLNEAQIKAAMETAQKLGIKTLSLERLREAVRSRALDPLINNPAVEALARGAGFKPLTPSQFQELAKLDTKIQEAGPTEAAKYYTQMHNILASAKPPKKTLALLTQGWINSALSSLSTAMLNMVHPVFVMGRRFMLDVGTLTAEVITGKVSVNDAMQTYVQMMGNWMRAFENFADDARFSLKNDAYSNRMLEVLNVAHGMHTDMLEAAAVLKDPKATIAERGKALVKVIFTSTDFMRRFLSTADQTWGSVISQYVVRNEAMRTLMREAGLSPEAAGILLAKANNDGLTAMNRHLDKTGDAVESRLVARDAMQESLAQSVAAATGRDTAGVELITTSRKEAELELGNRGSERGAWFDPVNFMAEIFKEIAWKIRRAGGERGAEAQGWRELIGRMATGFVTVPANILNRSAYFSPLGIGRALYRLKGDAALKEHYTETMATEGQARMRLAEGIAGTVGMLLLAMLKMSDDEDEGWNLTGEGPKDKGLREAWLKKGHKPAHIEYVDKKGNVLFSMPWARGGFDHLALPLTLIGTLDDMELNGLKKQPKNFSWAAAYGKDALVGLANQARFFGMKNLISAPSAFSEKSLAGTVAYSAAPVIPWAGLQKSIARMVTGQLDQSSVRSAVLAQLPLGISLAGTPALNALGDPKGTQPRDFATKASDRLEGAGIPAFIGIDVESNDGRLYSFMLEKGVSPSLPLRATMEAKNGFLADATWTKYLKTRGAIIKARLYRELPKLRTMKQADLQERMEKISSEATKEAKKKLNLQ